MATISYDLIVMAQYCMASCGLSLSLHPVAIVYPMGYEKGREGFTAPDRPKGPRSRHSNPAGVSDSPSPAPWTNLTDQPYEDYRLPIIHHVRRSSEGLDLPPLTSYGSIASCGRHPAVYILKGPLRNSPPYPTLSCSSPIRFYLLGVKRSHACP